MFYAQGKKGINIKMTQLNNKKKSGKFSASKESSFIGLAAGFIDSGYGLRQACLTALTAGLRTA